MTTIKHSIKKKVIFHKKREISLNRGKLEVSRQSFIIVRLECEHDIGSSIATAN